jgi:glycosyltransferase involved in cell wall biosynthesis
MNNTPKVSIITPVYNGGKYIAETLDTVLAQTFKDWEVVVMDGASKDNTLQILKGYTDFHPNIHVFSEPDEGPYDAIHKGINKAQGEYIFILCASDGYMNNDWIKMCVEKLDSDREVSLVWGIPFDITEEGKMLGPHFAYAHFLEGSNARGPFLKEMASRLAHPIRLMKKINASNIATARQVFKAEGVREKKDWFWYWLETGSIVPDGNMCLPKKVLQECLPPYKRGTREPGDWMGFFFNVNTKGYLSWCFPVGANYTRRVQQGSVTQRMLSYNDQNRKEYFERLGTLRETLEAHPKTIVFRDRNGNVI